MATTEGYAQISTAAVHGLLAAEVSDVEVYLPGQPGEGPVLYRGSKSAATGLDLSRLRDHGVGHVLVRSDMLLKCEQVIEQRLGVLLSNPNLPPADKAEIVHTAGAYVSRELLTGPVTSEKLSRASQLTDSVIDGILRDPKIAAYLMQMAGHERSTASHMQMVSTLAIVLGAEVFSGDAAVLKDLALAGLLHDIGKLSVPIEILQKKGPLTEEEVYQVQQHPIESVRLIGADDTVSAEARRIILQHHERMDGRGYPLGLTGADIALNARLLTIVDCFHAMIGPRSYRAQLSVEDANRVMGLQAGRQFDEELLDCWIGLCARQEAEGAPARPRGPVTRDDPLVKTEHLPSRRGSRAVKQRRPRYVCAGNAVVRCIYAGRLHEATAAPDDFGACVYDVSRGGVCIYSAYPMYRGEILHVRIKTGSEYAWLRSMVAWCRVHEPNVFKVGLQFVARSSEADVRERSDVQPLGGLAASGARREPPAKDKAKPARKKAPLAANNRREDALKRLAAIACMRKVSSEAQRTAVVLSTSADVAVRLKALEVLVQIDTRTTREAVVALLHDVHRVVRLQAIQVVGLHRIVDSLGALRELLDDADEEVALAAAGSLGEMGDWSGFQFVARTLEQDSTATRLAVRAFSQITGHRFSVNREGIESARRYLAARKKDFVRKAGAAPAYA